jgi:hypothetical protein
MLQCLVELFLVEVIGSNSTDLGDLVVNKFHPLEEIILLSWWDPLEK